MLEILLAAVLATADDPVFSGPQPGEKLVPFQVLNAYGRQAGKERDPIAAADGKPLVLVFVHQATRPSAAVTRAVLNWSEMHRDKGLHAELVYLDADRSEAEQYLKRATSWWGVGVPVGISVDGVEGPGAYGLNRNVTLTILVGHKNQVTANFALVQPSVTDVDEVLGSITKLIDAKVPGERSIDLLWRTTHLLPRFTARQGIAPQDPALRKLLCNVLDADDDPSLAAARQAVEEYVGENAPRRRALALAAKLLANNKQLDARWRDGFAAWQKTYAATR